MPKFIATVLIQPSCQIWCHFTRRKKDLDGEWVDYAASVCLSVCMSVCRTPQIIPRCKWQFLFRTDFPIDLTSEADFFPCYILLSLAGVSKAAKVLFDSPFVRAIKRDANKIIHACLILSSFLTCAYMNVCTDAPIMNEFKDRFVFSCCRQLFI